MYKQLDHIAIAVTDTEEALKIWRDKMGYPVLFSEKVNNETVLLTHLDMGNTHLQLVQPLIQEGALYEWLQKNGDGLHHFCVQTNDVGEAFETTNSFGLPPGETKPHQGTQGKRALFLDRKATGNVLVELTGK